MSRTAVLLRDANAGDAHFLAELWADVLRRGDTQDRVADLELIIKTAAESAEQRLVVAEYDGQPAGAVMLCVATLTPLDLEPCVQALAPCVLPSFRRKGVGWALMDASVSWAEELGIPHVATAAASGSRNGNRFMARLAFAPQAILRGASTHAVRARLTAQAPPSQRTNGGRQRVLAARRSLRRTRRSED